MAAGEGVEDAAALAEVAKRAQQMEAAGVDAVIVQASLAASWAGCGGIACSKSVLGLALRAL